MSNVTNRYAIFNQKGEVYTLPDRQSERIKQILTQQPYNIIKQLQIQLTDTITSFLNVKLSMFDELFLFSNVPLNDKSNSDAFNIIKLDVASRNILPLGYSVVYIDSIDNPRNLPADERFILRNPAANEPEFPLISKVGNKPILISSINSSNQTIERFGLLKIKSDDDQNEIKYPGYNNFSNIQSQEDNYRKSKLNIPNLKKYCCEGNNFNLPECSPAYLNNRQLFGALYYKIFRNTINNFPEVGGDVIKSGYLTTQLGKINDLGTNVLMRDSIYIEGYLNIPYSDTYNFQFTTSSGSIRSSISDVQWFEFGNNSPFNDVTNGRQLNAGSYPIKLLSNSTENGVKKINLYYTNSKTLTMTPVPIEWFSTLYYHDINTNLNNILSKSCSTPTDWYTNRCLPYMTSNPFVLKNSSQHIIDRCKNGSPDAQSEECKKLYSLETPNYDINKAYCSENNRFIYNKLCYDFATKYQNDFYDKQAEECLKDNKFLKHPGCGIFSLTNKFKQPAIDYCASSQKNWNEPQCRFLMNSIYKNDNAFYDQYCITNKNAASDYDTCKALYGENPIATSGKKFIDTVIDVCTTPNEKLFSNELCTSTGPHPNYLSEAITNKRTQLCKSDVTNPLCATEIKNYDIYGGNINEYCSANNFQNISNPICSQILTAADPRILIDGKLTDETIKKKLYMSKLNYCNQPNTFTNDSCTSWILKSENINEYDLLLKNNCTSDNQNTEPCQTVNNPLFSNLKAIPQFAYNKTKQCIDSTGKLIQNEDCNARNIQSNPYYTNLIEPTMKYCADSTNITNESCIKYISDLTDETKKQCITQSTFDNKEGFQDNTCQSWDFTNILLFILFVVIIVIIIKKVKYSKQNKIDDILSNLFY